MIAIIIGRAVQFLLALAMMRVATTILSPEEMGSVSLVLTTVAFFALFLVNPVGMFINRRLHAWESSGAARQYLIRYALYLILVTLIAAVGVLFLYLSGKVNFGVSIGWLLFLVCGSLFFNTLNQTAIPSLNLLGDSGRFILLTIATIATSFACATLLVHKISPVAQYWLLGLLLGQTLLAVIGVRVLFARLRQTNLAHTVTSISRRHWQKLLSFAWPVAIAAGLGWVQGQGYRYMIEGQLGLAQLGLFVAGYGISVGMIAGFESVLLTYFQPRLYRDVSTGHPVEQVQAWQRYAVAVIPSLLLTAALIVMIAPELTRIFLGPNFQSAVDYVIWGAFAEAARVAAGIYSLIAHMYMKTRWLIIPNLIGAVLSVSLCTLFIPNLGVMGVGLGLAVSGLAVVVTMHLLMVRHVSGGIPFIHVWRAVIAIIALWGVTLVLRNILNGGNWGAVIGTLAFVGVAYLGLQYLLLRQHLMDKGDA